MLIINHLIDQLQSGSANIDNLLEEVENTIINQIQTDENHQYLLNLAESVCLYTPLKEVGKPFIGKLMNNEQHRDDINTLLGQSDILYVRLKEGSTPSLLSTLPDQSVFLACNNYLFTYVTHEHLPYKSFVRFQYHGEFVTADVSFEMYKFSEQDHVTIITTVKYDFDPTYSPLVNDEISEFSQLLKEKIWNEAPRDVSPEDQLHRIIHSYAGFDQPRTIRLLQPLLSDPRYDDDVFGSAFCLATRERNNDVALFILHHKPKVAVNQYALSSAVNSTNQVIFDELLSRNIDLNQTDVNGNTPVFYMNHDCNFDENSNKEINNTAMFYKLVSLGMDVNHTITDGTTPLLRALRQNDFELTEILLDLDADINVLNHNGKGCVDHFAEYLEFSGYEHWGNQEAIEDQLQFLEKIKNQLSSYNREQLASMYTRYHIDIDKLTFDVK